MICFHNVTKRYPQGHEALRGVSFEIAPGEMAFLTGHSGAGKSTLMRLVALIERSTRGQVIVDGENRSTPVESMPGINRLSIDNLIGHASEAYELGIPAIALFPATQKWFR